MEKKNVKLNIDTGNLFDVYKIGDRSFQIGQIDCDLFFLNHFINLLDYGHKFIPNFYFDSFSVFKNVILDLDKEWFNFNNQLFFKDILISRGKDITTPIPFNNISFLEKLRRSLGCVNYGVNIPIMTETLDFQIETLCHLEYLSFDLSNNISLDEYNAIIKYQKEKPFKVVELDKNIGMAIISNQLYNDLAIELLSDHNTYSRINENPLNDIIHRVNEALLDLMIKEYISPEIFKALEVKTANLGKIRLLPKIHKDKFGLRPIISYKSNPTNGLCVLLDLIIRPFVEKSPSYIKDSQHFMQKNLNKKFPENANLFTFDVVSLYTNIKQEKCLDILSDFFKDKLEPDLGITISGFRIILKLTLENNYFIFNDVFYHQIKGIAMGSIAGPSIANIFVSCLESHWITISDPLSYVRFIDDIHYIDNDDSKISSLKEAFDDLELSMNTGESVDFLDLNISINKTTGELDFKPFFKKTNTFSYLLPTSNHPEFIFKNIPKSLFIRLRRICSNINDFSFFSLNLISHLVSRGYDSKTLHKIFNTVLHLDRIELLKYKEKEINEKKNNQIYFKYHFDNNVNNIRNIFKKSFDCFIEKNIIYKDLEINLINKMNYNISALFVHDFKFKRVFKNFYKKCNNFNCKTCFYFSSDYYIFLKENFLLPIFDNSNCKTRNCVYMLDCKLCGFKYIGETSCISTRIYTGFSPI